MRFFDKKSGTLYEASERNDELSCKQAFKRGRKKRPKAVKFGDFCIILAIIIFVVAKAVS